jgi:hypothetical protein
MDSFSDADHFSRRSYRVFETTVNFSSLPFTPPHYLKSSLFPCISALLLHYLARLPIKI